MAKLYKVELYVTDYNDVYNDVDDMVKCMEAGWGFDDVFMNCFNKQEVEIEFTDDIDLNYDNVDQQTYDKYFEK